MPSYRFAELSIQSDFLLFHLESDSSTSPVPRWRLTRDQNKRFKADFEERSSVGEPKLGSANPQVVRQPSGWIVRYAEGAQFSVDVEKRLISVTRRARLAAATLNHLIIDSLLPRLVAQEGTLLLHAAAIEIDGRVALLAGRSGAGKSTLAALLHSGGHRVLSDDCVVLSTGPDGVLASPTYPSLRVWPDSFAAIYGPNVSATAGRLRSRTKRHVALGNEPVGAGIEPRDAAQVQMFFQLIRSEDGADDCRVEPLGPSETQGQLLRHAFNLEVGSRERLAHLLSETAPVARAIPGFALRYASGFNRLPAVAALLRRHMASGAQNKVSSAKKSSTRPHDDQQSTQSPSE